MRAPTESVSIENVAKTFPETSGYLSWIAHRGNLPRRSAIECLNLRIYPGELFGLVGANGAGKSTILRMLAGLVTPDNGRCWVNGFDVAVHPVRARRQIGLSTGDERSFYFRLTARDNLRYFGSLAGVPRGELNARIREVATAVDLQDDLDRRFDRYSAGMRQRLGIARALLANPPVILFDEPTRAVDPLHAAAIRRFMREELIGRRGKTIVLATNLLEEAWELCNRVAILRQGRIVALGSPKELSAAHMSCQKYTISLDRVDDALLARLRFVPGLLDMRTEAMSDGVRLSVEIDRDPRSLTKLLAAVSANGVSITSVGPNGSRASEVFADFAGSATR